VLWDGRCGCRLAEYTTFEGSYSRVIQEVVSYVRSSIGFCSRMEFANRIDVVYTNMR
jgi:hypothetical protein